MLETYLSIPINSSIDQSTSTRSARKFATSSKRSSKYEVCRLVNKHDAAAILGVSPETLKKYRLQENSTLVEGYPLPYLE